MQTQRRYGFVRAASRAGTSASIKTAKESCLPVREKQPPHKSEQQPWKAKDVCVEALIALNRQHEFADLYKRAQRILLHELTKDEHSLVSELAFETHTSVSDEMLSRLRELVRRKGHLQS